MRLPTFCWLRSKVNHSIEAAAIVATLGGNGSQSIAAELLIPELIVSRENSP